MAIMPTPFTRYQQGWPRRVMLASIISSDTRKYAWSFPQRAYMSGRAVAWKGERGRETDPFDGPAEDHRLEVFRVCKLATLEDSDRVDDAQTAVKFSTRYVVIHTLRWTMVRTTARVRDICVGYAHVGNTRWTPPACCVCGSRRGGHCGRRCTPPRNIAVSNLVLGGGSQEAN